MLATRLYSAVHAALARSPVIDGGGGSLLSAASVLQAWQRASHRAVLHALRSRMRGFGVAQDSTPWGDVSKDGLPILQAHQPHSPPPLPGWEIATKREAIARHRHR